MKENQPQNRQPEEEVDLGQLFRLIGNVFNKLFKQIELLFLFIFSIFIHAIKPIIKYYKIILVSIVVSGVLGYVLEKYSKDVYVSQMLVKPYFESKYQLITNIDYYNALINDRDYTQLSSIFSIQEEEAKDLVKFEILPGPESENDRIKAYDNFIRSIDSVRAQEINYDSYIENRSVYSGSLFEITVKSHKKNLFKYLEGGLNSNFRNAYSVKKMKKRDSVLGLEKNRIINSLNVIDSLQKVYIKVMQEESSGNKKTSQISLRDGMSLIQERIDTKEFELLNKGLELRTALTKLESRKVEEDTYFDVLSGFQLVGSKYFDTSKRYSLVFPALILGLMGLLYWMGRLVRFVNVYEVKNKDK